MSGVWECFSDPNYFDMWCVRPVGERRFGYGYHLVNRDEAESLRDLLTAKGIVTPAGDETRSGSVERSEIEPGGEAIRPETIGNTRAPITPSVDKLATGFRAIEPTSEAHARVLEDLARRIDDE